jgi:hypothetical protein
MKLMNLTLAHELTVRTMKDGLPMAMIPADGTMTDEGTLHRSVEGIIDMIDRRGFLNTVAILQIGGGGDNRTRYSHVVFAFDLPDHQARELARRFHQERYAVLDSSGATVCDAETGEPRDYSVADLVRPGTSVGEQRFTGEFDRLVTTLLGTVGDELSDPPVIRSIVVPSEYVNTSPFNDPQSFFPFSDAIARETMRAKEAVL